MKCDQIRDRLTEFIDSELSKDEYKEFSAHIDNCIDCQRELESIKSFLDACKKWDDIRPSRDWESELKKKLTKSQRPVETEIEILRSAIIGLSQRLQKIEERQTLLPITLDGEIMTIEELARYLRLGVDKVYDIIDQIPKFQIGYEYRFSRESIDLWIRSLERDSEQGSSYPKWNIEDYEK